MGYEAVIVITVVALGMLLGVWGASLVVRAMASRASRIAMRLARRIPKRINTAPPQLSLVQFWFGVIVGPIVCLAGTSLCVFVVGAVALEGEVFRWSAVPPIMLVIFAMGALGVGYRWDKANGRRRCPKCWYDYAGLGDGAACPECGGVPSSARALSRTRRSRPIMLAAPVLLIAAWLSHVTPIAMRTSWRAFVPTTVLIGFYEYMPDELFATTGRADGASLCDRIQNEDLAYWQERWLGRRAARLLATSTDLRTCARSTDFAYALFDPLELPQSDATAANLLRVGLAAAQSTDPLVRARGSGILGQYFLMPGPMSRAAFAADQSVALDRFRTPVGRWDHRTFGRLIASFASPSDDVVACVRGVALDPQWQPERRDDAAALLGLLAARDPTLLARLEAEYPASQGDARAMLAIAIVSAGVQRQYVKETGSFTESTPEHDARNSAALAQRMRDPDVEIRRAAAKIPLVTPRLTAPSLDWTRTNLDLGELAKSDPECAVAAIRSLGRSGGVPDDIIPVIARILDMGSAEEVAGISWVLEWSRMDADWIAIREPLNTRVKDSTLDSRTLATLMTVTYRLDAMEPTLELEISIESGGD